jgi:hypothetical protein
LFFAKRSGFWYGEEDWKGAVETFAVFGADSKARIPLFDTYQSALATFRDFIPFGVHVTTDVHDGVKMPTLSTQRPDAIDSRED